MSYNPNAMRRRKRGAQYTWHEQSDQEVPEWLPFDEWFEELVVHMHRDPLGITPCGAVIAPYKASL